MGVFDYGSGNLHSVTRALAAAGAQVTLSGDENRLMACDALVVPGVGAFEACMTGLRQAGGDALIARWLEAERPLLGICVGHQILFQSGTEHGLTTAGLGIWPGQVQRLAARRLPHMGWNRIEVAPGSRLFAGIEDEWFYFVHSYAVKAADAPTQAMVSTSRHEEEFIAAIEEQHICATQFHPEKSGAAGARLLRNWLNL